MDELVSIVIPIYNAERYLNECLKSVKLQSYSKIEVILVNDGSNDKSKSICERMCLNDKRFKLYNNTNHGVSYSRNYGIKKSKGKYLCFVDADDIIAIDYVKELISEIRKNKCDLAICGIVGFKNNIMHNIKQNNKKKLNKYTRK